MVNKLKRGSRIVGKKIRTGSDITMLIAESPGPRSKYAGKGASVPGGLRRVRSSFGVDGFALSEGSQISYDMRVA